MNNDTCLTDQSAFYSFWCTEQSFRTSFYHSGERGLGHLSGEFVIPIMADRMFVSLPYLLEHRHRSVRRQEVRIFLDDQKILHSGLKLSKKNENGHIHCSFRVNVSGVSKDEILCPYLMKILKKKCLKGKTFSTTRWTMWKGKRYIPKIWVNTKISGLLLLQTGVRKSCSSILGIAYSTMG